MTSAAVVHRDTVSTGPLRLGPWEDSTVLSPGLYRAVPGSVTSEVGCTKGQPGCGRGGGDRTPRVPLPLPTLCCTCPFPPSHQATAHGGCASNEWRNAPLSTALYVYPHVVALYTAHTLILHMLYIYIHTLRVWCSMLMLSIYLYLHYEEIIFEPWSVVECHFVPHNCDLECPTRLTLFPVEPQSYRPVRAPARRPVFFRQHARLCIF